ncbi:hypothetical protein [Furfurilactobacillus siliginis]|nr:hypothetical protein [Furfurilactobacillus siliginis]
MICYAIHIVGYEHLLSGGKIMRTIGKWIKTYTDFRIKHNMWG